MNGSSAGASVSREVIINGMGTIPIQAGQLGHSYPAGVSFGEGS
jgi:hypothetical protein